MSLRGQGAKGQVDVHQRPPALKQAGVYGPFQPNPMLLSIAASEVTAVNHEFGLTGEGENRSLHLTSEANDKLADCFSKWYDWTDMN